MIALFTEFIILWAIIYGILNLIEKIKSAVNKDISRMIPEETRDKIIKKRRIKAAIAAAILTFINEFIFVVP